MENQLECNIQTLNDAIAGKNINVICEFFKSARRVLEDGGTVCVFEDFQPDSNYRDEKTFNSLDDFNKWTKQRFSMIDCG
jgi:hypothetical protein